MSYTVNQLSTTKSSRIYTVQHTICTLPTQHLKSARTAMHMKLMKAYTHSALVATERTRLCLIVSKASGLLNSIEIKDNENPSRIYISLSRAYIESIYLSRLRRLSLSLTPSPPTLDARVTFIAKHI